jgi:methylphosphotriester-DNA--protein-cysteine methyltransferase
MKEQRGAQLLATQCAAEANLSPSRFLHLFKSEVGVSFRNYRAWQRARGLLEAVTRGDSLTEIALDFGYPDSTHFSHSIRQIYGRTPRSILAGSRNLTLISTLR